MGRVSDVVLLAHGAAARQEEVEPYYRHIRGDLPTDPVVLSNLEAHYRAIGGGSPFNKITEETAQRLQEELTRRHGAGSYRVHHAYRHVPPFAEEVLPRLAGSAEVPILALPMAPHASRFLEHGYRGALEAARSASSHPNPIRFAGAWFREPDLVRFWARSLCRARERLPPEAKGRSRVLFSAHSLPQRMVTGTQYAAQLEEGARAIAAEAGIDPSEVEVCWQSASPGATEPWAGPDLLEMLPGLVSRGLRGVVVVPHGFLCDHLEVLYDLDLRARQAATDLGLSFARAEMPNSDPLLVSALAHVVERSDEAPEASPHRPSG